MGFKSHAQRRGFFGRVRPLPGNLINPYYTPKDAKYAVTSSKGIGAYAGKEKFYKKRDDAVKEAKRTKKEVFKIPKNYNKARMSFNPAIKRGIKDDADQKLVGNNLIVSRKIDGKRRIVEVIKLK